MYNVFRSALPPSVATFLLTLATVDDLGAIAVIAVCFAKSVSLPFLAAAGAIQTGLVAMERRKVRSGKPFIGMGLALWYCLLRAGVNADVAGVLTGLCVFGGKGNVGGIERLIKRWRFPSPACSRCCLPRRVRPILLRCRCDACPRPH